MRIVLENVSKGSSLPEMSLRFETGTATVVGVETARRPTVLGLVASGRMRPDTGSVRVDGTVAFGKIRTAIALVDAPDVSEPSGEITLAGVTAEELMFAGRSAGPWAVMRTLRDLGFDDYARRPMADLPPAVRIRALAELALLRPGVRGLVLTSPDRHGGEPSDWVELARELAERDLAILVVVGHAWAFADSTPQIPAGVFAAGALESPDDSASISTLPRRSISASAEELDASSEPDEAGAHAERAELAAPVALSAYAETPTSADNQPDFDGELAVRGIHPADGAVDVTRDATTEIRTDVASDAAPDTTPDVAPDITPDAAPDITHDAAPDITPDESDTPDASDTATENSAATTPAAAEKKIS